MPHSKEACSSGVKYSIKELAALTLIVHSSRPNRVQKLIIFVHMVYFSGFP